jgi:hypothetical protein
MADHHALITGHRREHFGKGSTRSAQRSPDWRASRDRFVTGAPQSERQDHVSRLLGACERHAVPRGYMQFVALMSRCRLVLTTRAFRKKRHRSASRFS